VPALEPAATRTYPRTDLELLDACWRAANHLSVGQIHLMDNPLLPEPLRAERVKPRLLGHWGTTPGSSTSSTWCACNPTPSNPPRSTW
jgi:xylulose-5-phosphate/fructose-6-phosphate phosphoketolase